MLCALMMAVVVSQLDAGAPEDTGSQVARETAQERRLDATSAAQLSGPSDSAPKAWTLGGYVEGYGQWNFNRPWNGITEARGFDTRHGTFTLQAVALEFSWDYEGLVGNLALHWGAMPAGWAAMEPLAPGSAYVAPNTGALWENIQQAAVGYRFPVGRGLLVQGGRFMSPVGPEALPVRDNWNWSRSNLFFILPSYFTGAKAAYSLTEAWTLSGAVFNGWNNVVDNNPEKTVMLQASWAHAPEVAVNLLYVGGVERPVGAPEGRAFRHLLDGWVTWSPHPRLGFIAQLDGGLEPNALGLAWWAGGALAARYALLDWLFLAARVDALAEHQAQQGELVSAPLFFGRDLVGEGTLTLEARPHARVSFRLEYRHDQASAPLYFGRTVALAADGSGLALPTARAQDTLTLGATSWF